MLKSLTTKYKNSMNTATAILMLVICQKVLVKCLQSFQLLRCFIKDRKRIAKAIKAPKRVKVAINLLMNCLLRSKR
ncbi:hypothetical protein D3C87_1526600 [compost metagenome]